MNAIKLLIVIVALALQISTLAVDQHAFYKDKLFIIPATGLAISAVLASTEARQQIMKTLDTSRELIVRKIDALFGKTIKPAEKTQCICEPKSTCYRPEIR